MGLFIDVSIDQSKLRDARERDLVARTCPVDVFAVGENALLVDAENEDECIFCNRCIDAAPNGGVTVARTYEEYMSRKG